MGQVVGGLISWRTRWRTYDYVRNSLWIVPFVFVGLALAVGYMLPIVDEHTKVTIGIVLDQIGLLLQQVGSRRLTPGIGRDGSGAVRFWYQAPSWEDCLSLAIDETRHYGEGSVQVMRRLRALLEDLRESLPEFRRASVEADRDPARPPA